MKKKRSIGYYAKKVIKYERLEAKEQNKIRKLINRIMKNYYTNKWERFYD